jgi:hypothetical protein
MPFRDQQDNELLNTPITGGYNVNPTEPVEVHTNPLAQFGAALSKGYGIDYALHQPITDNGKSAIDVGKAALRQYNTLGSFLGQQSGLPPITQRPDKNFDQFSLIPEDKQQFALRYYNANSRAQVDAISHQIDQEQGDHETMGGSGWFGGAATLGAGLLDPINLIPFGEGVHAAQGGNILKGAMKGALYGAGFGTLQEAGFQATQMTRTLGESASTIAGATLLSGLLGGGAGFWGRYGDTISNTAFNAAKATGRGLANTVEKGVSRFVPGDWIAGMGARLEEDLKVPKTGRFQPSELEPILNAASEADQHLTELKASGHAESSPEVIEATAAKNKAQQALSEAKANTTEPDPLEPGGVEVSPHALEADTANAAAHSAEGPISKGISERPAYESTDWLGLGEETIKPEGKPLSKSVLQKQIRQRISGLVESFTSKDHMLGEQPATDFLHQYDIPYKKAPKVGDGTGFQIFIPRKGNIPFPQGASLNSLIEQIGVPGLVAKLQKTEATATALEQHLHEVQQAAMGQATTDITGELASVDAAAQEGKASAILTQRAGEENAHLRFVNKTANDILERFHAAENQENFTAAFDFLEENERHVDGLSDAFMERLQEEIRNANDRIEAEAAQTLPDRGAGQEAQGMAGTENSLGRGETPGSGQNNAASNEPGTLPVLQGKTGEASPNPLAPEWEQRVNDEWGDESAWEDGDLAFEHADDGTVYAEAPIESSATANELLKDHAFLAKLFPDPSVLNIGMGDVRLERQDPLIRTIFSQSLETRRIIQTLAEVPLRYAKNALGVATTVPVEAIIKQTKAPLAYALKEMDDLFERYRFGQAGKFGKLRAEVGDVLNQGGQHLSYDEFKREIGRAMRNHDTHSIPEVAEAAKSFREKVFNPLKERAIKVGVLGEQGKQLDAFTGGQDADPFSYLTRVWDIERIIAKRSEFLELNLEWLKGKEQGGRTDEQLRLVADRIIDRIIGAPNGRLEYNLVHEDQATGALTQIAGSAGGSGGGTGRVRHGSPLHTKIYDIPDQWVEEFLVNDIEYVAKKYERTMSPDVALMEAYKTPDLTTILEGLRSRIATDWDLKMRGVADESLSKRMERLKRADIRDIEAVFSRLRGTYGLPADPNSAFVRGGKILRTENYLSLMGGVALSSIPDLAGPVLVHGMKRFIQDGLVPLVSDFKTFRLAAEDVKLAGAGLDMILDSRAMALGELMDDYGRGSQFERGLHFLQEGFSKASGISQWTASLKQLAGMMTQTRLLQAIKQTVEGGVSSKELENLAASYIDETMAHRIYEQFGAHGRTQGSVHLPNTNAWEDLEALKVFRSAIVKDVDRIIVTPGQDKPLFLSTEMGKLFGQFKSFAFAGTQRVLMTGIQNRDLATLNGAVFATSLGILVTLIKSWQRGDEIDMSPQALIAEGIDRAGLTGWLFDANNILEKATRGHIGISRVLGKQPSTRYASRSLTDALFGPTAGKFKDIQNVSSAISQAILPGEDETGKPAWQSADSRAVRRLIPFQNLFYLRGLFDLSEDRLNDIMGVESDEREAKTE